MIAPCGIDCRACDLLRASTEEEAAERLVPWFRQQGWLKPEEDAKELMSRGPYCAGCRGDRSVQWSGDCKIRQCCVDEKGLEFCSDCSEFPCEALSQWASAPKHHTEALERLRAKRSGSSF